MASLRLLSDLTHHLSYAEWRTGASMAAQPGRLFTYLCMHYLGSHYLYYYVYCYYRGIWLRRPTRGGRWRR